jgi:hypothetical protein
MKSGFTCLTLWSIFRTPRLAFFLALSLPALWFPSPAEAADPVSELSSFSTFGKVDPGELLNGEAETEKGPQMGDRYLSVQSCYAIPGSPARQLEALRQWDPARHRELKVFVYGDVSTAPSPANFSKLRNAPDNGSVRAFVSATQKMSSDLQLSREEAKKFSGGGSGGGGAIPPAVAAFWSNLLAERAKVFVSGGTAAQPAYNHGNETIRPNDELKTMLKQQDKIRRHFADFLSQTAIGRGASSLKPDLYWELLDVDDQGVVTLGATYDRSVAGGGEQIADVLYYASGGYYVALTLYQMWPVTIQGKASTLVWRGDMISAASLESLHGVERLASEGVMKKDISKAIAVFRRESGR